VKENAMDAVKAIVTPSIPRTRTGTMTVFEFLSKCGGKEIFHFNDSEDMKLNIEDAYQYAQDLRSMLAEAHGAEAPTVVHSTNRVIMSLAYEKVSE
jgi:hypothetical protein